VSGGNVDTPVPTKIALRAKEVAAVAVPCPAVGVEMEVYRPRLPLGKTNVGAVFRVVAEYIITYYRIDVPMQEAASAAEAVDLLRGQQEADTQERV